MTEPTRIRAQLAGDRATVRLLMAHEMESGHRKDGSGKTVPAWFVQEVTVLLDGRPVLTAQCGPSLAKNPFLQFNLRGVKAGDRLAVAWRDNRGASRSDEVAVTA